ncbi:hypothetical protein Bbelb_357540 [Branchiostoma belcheri]|nr:hypothetical protein Bbelb_443890 [Branchiostoma belcheri]KAI8483775.1 hypothetical protein Bbelb_385670 [Branchiostoma belcheri]KAI8486519.1 hypothetical protein Bbelb_357540 [Branchiostoma belcheri]
MLALCACLPESLHDFDTVAAVSNHLKVSGREWNRPRNAPGEPPLNLVHLRKQRSSSAPTISKCVPGPRSRWTEHGSPRPENGAENFQGDDTGAPGKGNGLDVDLREGLIARCRVCVWKVCHLDRPHLLHQPVTGGYPAAMTVMPVPCLSLFFWNIQQVGGMRNLFPCRPGKSKPQLGIIYLDLSEWALHLAGL